MDEKNPDIIPENPENNTFEDDFVIGKGFEISEEPVPAAYNARTEKTRSQAFCRQKHT